MQTLKDEVRQNIIDAAQYEFKHNGYEKASIRKIAKRAGMTEGNVYRYFRNKEYILEQIVHPVYTEIIELVDFLPLMKDEHEVDFKKTGQYLMDTFVSISRNSYDALLILIDGCHGTRYETAHDEVVSLLEKNIRTVFFMKLKNKGIKIEDEFLAYVIAKGFVEGMIRILKHFEDPDKMKSVLVQYHQFYMKNSIERFQ